MDHALRAGQRGAFDPARGFVRVMEELAPLASEAALTKTTINTFGSTDLEELLRREGSDRVVVCGIRTEQCCETTIRVAADLGFDVEFITHPVQGIHGVPARLPILRSLQR